jgi:hypothetical protein
MKIQKLKVKDLKRSFNIFGPEERWEKRGTEKENKRVFPMWNNIKAVGCGCIMHQGDVKWYMSIEYM